MIGLDSICEKTDSKFNFYLVTITQDKEIIPLVPSRLTFQILWQVCFSYEKESWTYGKSVISICKTMDCRKRY